MVAVCLRDFAQGLALGEEAPDDAVVALVAPTFAGGIWVAVVDCKPLIAAFIMLHAVAVLELGAVVHSDGLEGIFRELFQDFIKGTDSGAGGLIWDTQDDFIAGHALSEDKKGLALTLGFAYHTVKLPVAEGLAGRDDFRAALYTGSFRRALCFYMTVGTLAQRLFPEVPVGDIRDITPVDIAVQSDGGDRPPAGFFERSGNLIGGTASLDLCGNETGVVMIMAELEGRALCGSLKIGVLLGNICRIMKRTAGSLRTEMRVKAVPDFSVDGGDGKACYGGDGTIGGTVVIESFDDETVRLCHTAIFGSLFHHNGLLSFLKV